MAENVVVVDCAGELAIDFLSGIDQAEADEAWAFSNVQVVGSNGETVILDETRSTASDGAAAAGWSNAEITNVGSAGNVHGPWGNDVRDVTLEVGLPAGNAFCEVSWRQWAVDSRDNEVDRVTIDGAEVWSMAVSRPDQGCGSMGWEEGPADFPAPYGGAGGACFDEIEVQVPCTPPTLTVNFLSGIDQAETDEAWAFSDVRVVGRPAAGGDSGGGGGDGGGIGGSHGSSAVEPLLCAAGQYEAAGLTTCSDCPAGKYVEATGSDEESDCIDCIFGTYLPVTGSDEAGDCIDCAVGKYVEATGSDQESDCIESPTPECDPVFLGPDIGMANVFEYNDDTGDCQIDMSEVAAVCTTFFQECLVSRALLPLPLPPLLALALLLAHSEQG